MGAKHKDEEAIYYAAVAKPPAERAAYLKAVCGNDAGLLARVEALLKAHDVDDDFLKVPPVEAAVTLDDSPLTEGPGTVIGRYKLLEKIGEGGMASVYMAEQEKPTRRKVALKIIKLGMDTKQVIARFDAERQALSMMEHPNIAKVLDAGATETGRPFFVMELVKGVSITEYCDRNKLNTQERLDLFFLVCNAVQHAHQRGIIHRDIKPSNVMVTLHDGKAVPKVIDFGIAKATSQRLTEKTLFTRYAQMIGTPAYMSPEQAELSGLDIDTRTDIYSLGVLLYELLTGTTPFDVKELREAGYFEMQRIIREEEPVKPSTKLSTMGEALTGIAEHRKTNPNLLPKLVRGDLDWIVMKTLEKDRIRRYETVNALALDIQQHLNHEPVRAGPPSNIYRLKKFVRKHRTSLTTTTGILVAVILGVSAATMYIDAEAQRRKAEQEFIAKERAIAEQERQLRTEQYLLAAERLHAEGQYQQALSKVEAVLESKTAVPEARLLHARLLFELNRSKEAVVELDKLSHGPLEIASAAHYLLARIYLGSDPTKAKEHQQRGENLFSESVEAYSFRAMTAGTVRETIRWLHKALDLEPRHYQSRKALALAYYADKDYQKMEQEAYTIIVIRQDDSLGYLLRGIARREMGQFDDAIKDHNRAIEICDDDHELYSQRRESYFCMGNYEQALSDARTCVRLRPNNIIYRFHVFNALVALGRYAEAKAEYSAIVKAKAGDRFEQWASNYVFKTLSAGQSPRLPTLANSDSAFVAMQKAADYYHRLDTKADRVVAEGFKATWSPDGTELAYSRGLPGSAGIEILNFNSQTTRLLTVPGKDPAWSPDGRYIAFVRAPQTKVITVPATRRVEKQVASFRAFEEVWIITPTGDWWRRLAKGGFPSWSADSKRLFFHSRKEGALCSIVVDDPAAKPIRIMFCPTPYPSVSPDGKYVAYVQSSVLYIVELPSGKPVASWRPPVSIMWLATWSPDGREISVGGGQTSADGLWIFDMYSQQASKVFDGPATMAAWSYDRSRLAFDIRTPYWEIWVAELDPQVCTPEALELSQTIEEYSQEEVDYYTRQIGTHPEDAGNYLERAKYYLYLQDEQKVLADLEKYADIVKNPLRVAQAYINLAWGFVREPQDKYNPEIAVRLAQKAIEKQPESGSYNFMFGVAYYRAGQWKEAIKQLTKATEMRGGKHSKNFFFLAMAHWQLGNKDQAQKWYEQAIKWLQKYNPNHLRLCHFRLEAAALLGVSEQTMPNEEEVVPGKKQ